MRKGNISQRSLFTWGLVLVTVGVFTYGSLGLRAWWANIGALFPVSIENQPSNIIRKFHCPYYLNVGSSATIRATFRNTTPYVNNYRIEIQANGFGIDYKPGWLAVPSGQLGRIPVRLTAMESGAQLITLKVFSSLDKHVFNDSPFYAYPNSFQGTCKVLVSPGPVGVSQLYFLARVVAIVGAIMLATWLVRRKQARQ